VSDDDRIRVPAPPDEFGSVVDQQSQALVIAVGGPVRCAVPAQVGRHDGEAGVDECGNLVSPARPVLRETVQQEDERALAGACDVQLYVACMQLFVMDFDVSYFRGYGAASASMRSATAGPLRTRPSMSKREP
jgi:hypothetical protein